MAEYIDREALLAGQRWTEVRANDSGRSEKDYTSRHDS